MAGGTRALSPPPPLFDTEPLLPLVPLPAPVLSTVTTDVFAGNDAELKEPTIGPFPPPPPPVNPETDELGAGVF